jgi:hypothetical protein
LVAIEKEGNSSARRISCVEEGLPLYLAEASLHNLEVLFEVGSQVPPLPFQGGGEEAGRPMPTVIGEWW